MTTDPLLEAGRATGPELRIPEDCEDRDTGIWRLVLIALIIWLVLNRAVPDLYVLPLGVAIRPAQVVLGSIMVLLVMANAKSPRRWPSGVPALAGLFLLIVVTMAPFLASEGFDTYQSAGAKRGLFYFAIYVVLFLSAYQVAQRSGAAIRLVVVTVVMTVWQSLLVLYEWRAGAAEVNEWPIWKGLGLAVDVIDRAADFRPGDLFRPKSTAPHPIVISALLAVAILLTVVLLLEETDRRRKVLLGIGIMPMTLAMMVVDTRTGFVVLFVGGLAIIGLQLRKIPRFLPMALAGMAAFGVAIVMSPDSVRSTLNLFWNAGTDNSVGLRVDRLSSLPELIAENPILGPGWLTNDPTVLLWDNTYNLALIELGIVGTAVYTVFLVSSIVRMIGSRRLAVGNQEITLLLAGIVGGVALLVGGTTFDALAFDQFLPTCLLLIGIGLATADRPLKRRRPAITNTTEISSDQPSVNPHIDAALQSNRRRLT